MKFSFKKEHMKKGKCYLRNRFIEVLCIGDFFDSLSKMQQKAKLCLLLSTVMLLSSCSNIRSIQLTKLTNEESKKIEQMSSEILKCFTEKDKGALKELFCEQIRNQTSFDNEIDRAFEYFPCEVYTTSEIDNTASGGESVEMGKRTKWYVSPDIPYIEILVDIDKNASTPPEPRYYSMHYYWQIVNDKEKSSEGLQYIRIELLNIDSMKLGNKID